MHLEKKDYHAGLIAYQQIQQLLENSQKNIDVEKERVKLLREKHHILYKQANALLVINFFNLFLNNFIEFR